MKWSNKYMGIKINLKIILYVLAKKKKKNIQTKFVL